MSDSSPTTAELDNTQLQQAKDTAAWLIEEAKRQGADAAEVGVSLSQGYSVNVRQGEVETVEFHRDRGVSVTVYKGQRKGHASSSDDNRDSLRATLAAATAIAGYTEEDRYAGLAPAADLAKEVTDLDLYHPWAMDTQSAIEQALRCETVARDDARIVNSEGASVNSGASLRVYATSEGFLHGYRGTHHSRVCSVVAEDEAGMQRDYWYDGGRVGDRLASAEAVGEQARERALARLDLDRFSADVSAFLTQAADGADFDAGLTAEQKGVSLAFQRLAEEHLYWSIVAARWLIDDNWAQLRDIFFGPIPKLIRPIIAGQIRKKMIRDMHGHGMGRHSLDEQMQFGIQNLAAIADWLGDKPFMHGDTPTAVDASVGAFVGNIHGDSFDSPLRDAAQNNKALGDYAARIKALYYPDGT